MHFLPQELLDKCNPLGMFDAIASLAVAQNMRDLYRLVLVDTPLAPYFSENLTSEDLDEMNIEVSWQWKAGGRASNGFEGWVRRDCALWIQTAAVVVCAHVFTRSSAVWCSAQQPPTSRTQPTPSVRTTPRARPPCPAALINHYSQAYTRLHQTHTMRRR